MEVLLLAAAGASPIQFGNALATALGCAVPLVVAWYIVDAGRTPSWRRLFAKLEIFAAPLLLTLLYAIIERIVRILAG